ncbi:MAG: 50S ribosomal protein L5 [Candidatus Latescibacteria bacterium]|nr:50S ribosomal protein L5 [Candidatus Latescibacterota bacterium]NIM20814.1 50S ribosomal protein L5 [Candidatus Latescibacterota bacterium]NIM64380.1 50S ribosomal protein L5 [Candidatus Latescibacterota bacterium]NIO00531.1 50S ribosomal protein L5 [Candidatus Latescibacterota bacterium]NIO26934.1 50S ribosomal protein L5 [Candidatus Latescibacterota bacterium]
MSRIKEKYFKEIVPELRKEFGFKNLMEVPRLDKITVNMGVGEANQNPKLLDAAMEDLAAITGQKPKLCRAKISVAAFKIREGMPVGCKVTLRGERMYEFYDRLVNISLPRIRDFRGVPTKSFDGRGNYTLGIKEHIIFPEINYDKIMKIMGMDITIVTTAKNDEQGLALLKHLNMPFRTT